MNESEANANMENKCPQCGSPLPSGVLAGLCPACLFKQGAAADTAAAPDTAAFQPPTVEEIAKLFPQLEVLGFLGKGGMGAVYKARQPGLDRIVALKIIPPQAAAGPGFIERFNREARALAKLNHPNIISVHEFGQVNGLPYFLMEYVDGLNLRQLEQAGKLTAREALQIVPQICEALQFAHDEGIVHRDIKPENILLDKKGRVKIADFGIAKILSSGPSAAITETGGTIGTPHYMAPEQMEKPTTVDHRADIFSLGVVFYEMLTGELPLGKFAPPSSRKVEVDVRLDDVVLRALEKDPELRYQHASQVKTAVNTIAGSAAPPPESDAKALAAQILAQDYTLDIGSCLRRGWKLLRANFWPFVGITALLMTMVAFAASVGGESLHHGPLGPSSGPITSLLGLIVLGPLEGGLFLYYLKKIRGEQATVETVFSGFSKRFLHLFLAGFVTVVLTWIGSYLILPGIYLLVAWLFAVPLVADRQIDFWSAMEASRKVITKHWFKFFGFALVSLLLFFLGALFFGVGVFITTPWVVASLMYAYEDVIGSVKQTAPPPVMPAGPFGTSVLPKVPATASRGWNVATIIGVILATVVFGFLFFAVLLVGVRTHYAIPHRLAQQQMVDVPLTNEPTPTPFIEPVEAPAATHPTFTAIKEFDLRAGTNQFLDLDKQQLLTNSGDFPSLFTGNWLNQSGADLMYGGDGTFMAFGGVYSPKETFSTNWDDITADEISAAMDPQTPPPGGRAANVLTRDQPLTWFFKTREGAKGILQIVAFTSDPPAAKIRYKLLQETNGDSTKIAGELDQKTTQEIAHRFEALANRLEAAKIMNDLTSKNRALSTIAIDAAKAYHARIATDALNEIYDSSLKSQTALEVVRVFAKLDMKKQALTIAKSIDDYAIRDQALSELAQ